MSDECESEKESKEEKGMSGASENFRRSPDCELIRISGDGSSFYKEIKMSGECDKCGEHCLDCKCTERKLVFAKREPLNQNHVPLNKKEIQKILKCMDIANDEFGPFPSRNMFHKLYKKLKSYE